MSHQNFKGANLLYPSLLTIVGADVEGKPNWMTIAHMGIMNHGGKGVPNYLSISCHPSHHTNIGIRENGEFSVNIPGQALRKEADFAGIVSGKTRDKSTLFPVFRGELAHAPMIATCPMTMECKVDQVIQVGEHEVFIGEICGSYVAEDCIENGKADLKKVDPILFDFTKIKYWSLGEISGQPWGDGKALKES